MKKKQRETLRELMGYCNQLGGRLDGTSTAEAKYKDRQESLMDVAKIVYAVLTDSPHNEYSDEDYECAQRSLNNMKALTEKNYPDKNGLFSFQPQPEQSK